MGCPLAPVLPNIFMGFHEHNIILANLRYVDDILAAFGNEQDCNWTRTQNHLVRK